MELEKETKIILKVSLVLDLILIINIMAALYFNTILFQILGWLSFALSVNRLFFYGPKRDRRFTTGYKDNELKYPFLDRIIVTILFLLLAFCFGINAMHSPT